MQAASAAKTEQGKICRVKTFLDGNHPECLGHVLIGQCQHPFGGLFHTQAQL